MKKILLVWGWTAREHIIAEKLKANPEVSLFAYWVNNPWISDIADNLKEWGLKEENFWAIVSYAQENEVDWAFIGPDNPIWDWLADALLEGWIKSFAPTKMLAQLESSKWFTRKLLETHWIEGNPKYKCFEWSSEFNKEPISNYIDELWGTYVVKYDQLLWWKWVKLSWEHLETKQDWINYAIDCLEECWRVVIEEKLVWEEFSLMCFADWITLATMPTVQDYKRAFEWDRWPNTWWMGTYSHESWILPFLTPEDVTKAKEITLEVMKALEADCWSKYKWIMYWWFIATKTWIKLIEYNARFWDPEVMNLLTLLKTDLTTICEAVITETLSEINIEFENKATVCKYLAAQWYPQNPIKWEILSFSFDPKSIENLWIYYWWVTRSWEWEYTMWSSRAIALVAKWDTATEAKAIIDEIIPRFSWKFFYRKDIGSNELIQKRIDNMKFLRGK